MCELFDLGEVKIQDTMRSYDFIMKWLNITLKYSGQKSEWLLSFDMFKNANKMDYLITIISDVCIYVNLSKCI